MLGENAGVRVSGPTSMSSSGPPSALDESDTGVDGADDPRHDATSTAIVSAGVARIVEAHYPRAGRGEPRRADDASPNGHERSLDGGDREGRTCIRNGRAGLAPALRAADDRRLPLAAF